MLISHELEQPEAVSAHTRDRLRAMQPASGETDRGVADGTSEPARKPDRNDFFFLDPELPRWSHLLAR